MAPLIFLLQVTVCGQEDPLAPDPSDSAFLWLEARDEAGLSHEGASLRVAGNLQEGTIPLQLELPGGESYLFALEQDGFLFSPAETSLSLHAGSHDTLTFLAEELPEEVQRLVIIEDFSNTDCSTCPQADEALWEAVEVISGEVLPLAFHVFWPQWGDPFYQYNPAMQNQRYQFYGISSAPNIRVDGAVVGDPFDSDAIRAAAEYRLLAEPSLSLQVESHSSESEITVSAEGEVLLDPGAGAWRLYLLLYETHVEYAADNGQTEFLNSVRHVNSESGALGIPISLNVGESFSALVVFTPDFNEVNPDSLRAAAFVQSSSGDQLILDAAMEDNSGGP
ncbi:MAG: DUF1223 domain-containing protein [Candidatus Krumholzibacteria bacterium]|jgi:hypothetical protein|nr:DUF1223 domain-containing protein [Candidatus Krumholzibacteria bacterium]MDP6669887.1 DUF1223 domain-containing protein [Candidatus Krumholzibacteria bacterium]MDP6796805.1 DUF1223 domain-containing protein [Candidatus Krumholzibacteria bacterium]MDP7021055.1 DUF1223 domain-containing protein [Candidatus Krumholzibacteria bacterium]